MSFLPTKGLEYLLVLGYLALLIPFWWLVERLRAGSAEAPTPLRERQVRAAGNWFALPDDVYLHRGHSWVREKLDAPGVEVGMDAFAYGLMGSPSSLQLPAVGSQLREGEKGWSARIDGHVFDVLSPVSGEVVESHESIGEQAAAAAADPYRSGWLLRVRPSDRRATFANLMPAPVGRFWMQQVQADLSRRMGLADAVFLQDGGLPVSGIARQIGGDHWHQLVQEFLLTQELMA